MTDTVISLCSEDEPSQLNGSESQERHLDGHRSRSKDADRSSRGRESDPEKAASRSSSSRSDDAALIRSLTRDRVRPSDDVSEDRVWSSQQEEVAHEKVRAKQEGSTRGRRSKHRLDEPVTKVTFVLQKYSILYYFFLFLYPTHTVDRA